MSRNADRLGLNNKITTPVQTNSSTSPVPTEFVLLPSKGKFYSPEHPLHGKESVEIRYMTTKEEEILTNKSLIKEGVVIDKLIQSVLVEQDIKVESLLLGDKNAIVVACRINSFGPEYKINVVCPVCSGNIVQDVDLEVLINGIEEPEQQNVVISQNGTFDVLLGSDVVTLRLLTGKDEAQLTKLNEKKAKYKQAETPIQDLLRFIVVAVNGNEDRKFIEEEFIPTLLAKHSRKLRSEYQKVVPNIDLEKELECGKCGSDVKITIPFTASFFWPDR